ncbi:MAG: class I SAM-dependent methyltransferase [Euryarchaeota archaeon]|nr:class I SAM-dependent methyltransferase [Euryarchaeota archaeon]
MPKYEIKNSVVNIAEGDGISQSIHSSTNSQKDLSQNNAEAHELSEEPKESTTPFLSDLESEICDIFKSVYQKERNADASEVNSKTLEFLKYKLLDLAASGKRIDWLDVGCGDGRSLDVLDAVQNIGNIRYHGTDSSYKYFGDTEKRARKYELDARLDKIDAAAMKFDSEYDVISAVLLLHEVDPLCLPYILRNMLQALKGDGTLIIADFQGPYEQEEGVVAWGVEDIENLLESIGGAKMGIEFVPSSQYPDELGFYRCYVKKPGLDREKFGDLLHGYGNFQDAKKEESKRKREELRSQIKERVRKLLNRSDVDLKNISEEEMRRIRNEIGDEYGIKAHKIRLLTSQIEFLNDKIEEFNSGSRCAGADQRTS